MAWIDPVTKDDIFSTTETAESIGIHPVTLRRWLATEELQQWLKEQKKRPLRSVALNKGGHTKQHHIWQFGNQNRTDLREFLRERREMVREENKPKQARITLPRSLNARERLIRKLIRQYAKAVVDLQRQGFAPQDARLVEFAGRPISRDEMVYTATEFNHGQWWR